MEPLREVEQSIIADLIQLGDTLARSEFLIRCGKAYFGIPEDCRQSEDIIKDCQVRTWVHLEWDGDTLHYSADSESLLVKGALSLFDELYNGRSRGELEGYENELVKQNEFLDLFTFTQQQGILSIIKMILVK